MKTPFAERSAKGAVMWMVLCQRALSVEALTLGMS